MEDNEIEIRLKSEYELLNSPQYKQFTKQFMMEFGNELDEMFPGVTFVMYLRYKSFQSVSGKIKRICAREDREAKNIYDYIGLRIVVSHVSDKVKHKNCQDIIKERERLYNDGEEKKAYKDNLILDIKKLVYTRAKTMVEQIKCINLKNGEYYEFMLEDANENGNIARLRQVIKTLEEYIDRNQDKEQIQPQEEKIKQVEKRLYNEKLMIMLDLLKQINENIQLKKDLYNEQNRKCNDLYSQYMIEQIKKNSKVLKKLGISAIPGRYKKHTGSQHYYVATHDCFKTSKSSEFKGWKTEIQVTSDYHNQEAEQGKARHSEKEGKTRVLPNSQEIPKRIADTVPEIYLYINSTKQKKGTVIECSKIDRFYNYYREVIPGKEYLKSLYIFLNSESDGFER